jgi:gliding motility-associated lipoprotein GldH
MAKIQAEETTTGTDSAAAAEAETVLKTESNKTLRNHNSSSAAKVVMAKIKNISMGLLCLISMISCINSPIMHKYESLKTDGWKAGDTVNFEIPIQSEDRTCNLSINTRSTESYPFTDFHVKAIVKRNGKIQTSKDFKINIYGDNGKAEGNGFLYYENKSTSSVPLELKADSVYTISIVHKMRRSPICGISDIGILIE